MTNQQNNQHLVDYIKNLGFNSFYDTINDKVCFDVPITLNNGIIISDQINCEPTLRSVKQEVFKYL